MLIKPHLGYAFNDQNSVATVLNNCGRLVNKAELLFPVQRLETAE